MSKTSFEKREIIKAKINMVQAFDNWRACELDGSPRERVFTQGEGFRKLAERIKQDFGDLGYTIGAGSIANHFNISSNPSEERRALTQAPYFLLVWYAKEFGITLDELLTGHRNTTSKILSAKNEREMLLGFDDEIQSLREQLGAKLDQFKYEELKDNVELKKQYGKKSAQIAWAIYEESQGLEAYQFDEERSGSDGED